MQTLPSIPPRDGIGVSSRARALALATSLFAGAACAAEYPARPVRLIIPYAPGGAIDITGRLVAAELAKVLGQQVIADNRGGGGGTIGADIVAEAQPDGYTLLFGNEALAINASLQRSAPFDTRRDLLPVTQIITAPRLLVLHPAFPAKNVRELLAWARTRPGELRYGSSGVGTGGHLVGAMLAADGGVQMTHVPYKGISPAVTDVMAGQIQMAFASAISVYSQVQAGKLRAIAVTSTRRSHAFPDVPTVAEDGVPGFQATAWSMLIAPQRTPAPLLARLHKASVEALAGKDFRDRIARDGGDVLTSTPPEAARFLIEEIDRWARVVKASGAKAE